MYRIYDSLLGLGAKREVFCLHVDPLLIFFPLKQLPQETFFQKGIPFPFQAEPPTFFCLESLRAMEGPFLLRQSGLPPSDALSSPLSRAHYLHSPTLISFFFSEPRDFPLPGTIWFPSTVRLIVPIAALLLAPLKRFLPFSPPSNRPLSFSFTTFFEQQLFPSFNSPEERNRIFNFVICFEDSSYPT